MTAFTAVCLAFIQRIKLRDSCDKSLYLSQLFKTFFFCEIDFSEKNQPIAPLYPVYRTFGAKRTVSCNYSTKNNWGSFQRFGLGYHK